MPSIPAILSRIGPPACFAAALVLAGCGDTLEFDEAEPVYKYATNRSFEAQPVSNDAAERLLAQEIQGQTLRLIIPERSLSPKALQRFTRVYGVAIQLKEYDSSGEMRRLLDEGEAFDLALASHYTIEHLAQRELLRELDPREIPYLSQVRDEDLLEELKPFYEQTLREYWIPYSWATLGIGYDSDTLPVTEMSWDFLFAHERISSHHRERLDEPIGFLGDARLALGAALIHLGRSPNTTNAVDLADARDLILGIKNRLRLIPAATVAQDLGNRRLHLSLAWGADVSLAKVSNSQVRFGVPREGTIVFLSGFVMSRACQNTRAASAFLEFMLKPEIAGMTAEFTHFASASEEAKEFIDRFLINGPSYYIPEPGLRAYALHDLGDEAERLYDAVWKEIVAQEATEDQASKAPRINAAAR